MFTIVLKRPMFQNIELAPRDPILGLTEAFRADANPLKINLGVGVFQDEAGTTPILATVAEASRRIVASQTTKSYLPITGAPEYAAAVQELTFGAGHEVLTCKRAATAHTPGGTGALRVAGDFIAKNLPGATLWLSQPTWENHGAVFAAAGVPTKNYAYFDKATNGLAFDALLADIRTIPAGDVILLHGCCHNPTGIDPTPAQWKQIAAAVRERGVLPLLDFAYQGFGVGIVEDAAGLREFCTPEAELLVCSSFSKNFGLYRERVGAITLVAANAKECAAAESQLKRLHPHELLEPPGARRRDCENDSGRRRTSHPVGGGSRRDARADPRHAVAAGEKTGREGRPRELRVHQPPAGDVLVFGPDPAASRPATRRVRHLYGRLGAD